MTTGSGWDGILAKGERILWQGQPEKGVVWHDMISALSFVGVFFTGFSLFWILAAMAMTAQAPFPFSLFWLFGLPFLGIGLFMLGGHAVFDAWLRAHTWYTLTDRTAFIATDVLGKKTLGTYPIAEMAFLELDDGAPGSILFAHGTLTGSQRGRAGKQKKIGFRRIAEARRLFGEMRELRRAARSGAGEAAE